MVPKIKESKAQLDVWCDSPDQLVQPQSNIFGEPLDPSSDPVLSALLTSSVQADVLPDLLSKLLNACRSVYTRQLVRYLDPADLAEPTEDQLLAASSAPTHNMASERALGMTDAQWRRAPNVTLGFLNGKVKSKLNKTLDWVKGKEDKEKMIAFAASEGYRARKRDRKRKAALQMELKRRQDASAQQRDEAARKKTGSVVKSLIEHPDSGDDFAAALHKIDINCCPEVISQANQIALDPQNTIIGSLFEHALYDREKEEEVVWFGRANGVEEEGEETGRKRKRTLAKKRVVHLVVSYWPKEDTEGNAEDYNIPLADIIADLLHGDVAFIN